MGELLYRYLETRNLDNLLILDSGAGSGGNIEAKVINLDILKPKNINEPFIIGDGTNIPIQTNSIDIVISNQVLEHIPNNMTNEYISETSRILKNTGEFYLSFPNRLFPLNPHKLPLGYSYLPKSVGNKVAKQVFSNDIYEYYRDKIHNLSAIKARKCLHKYFDSVEFITPDVCNQVSLSRLNQESTKKKLQLYKYGMSILHNIPGHRMFIEITISNLIYKCENPQSE